MINGSTKVYGIIGDPVKHSLSPAMHNKAFSELGINGVYLPFPVESVKGAAEGLKSLGIKGCSVTIPHKQAIIEFLDEIDPVAAKIGAVNTIFVDNNNKLFGSNTDWIGANSALKTKTELKAKKVVLLGAGGSARAIGFGLIEEGCEIILCSRTEKSGKELATTLDCPWYSLDEIPNLNSDILVNATSVGMSPNNAQSLVAKQYLEAYETVMDIVYSPLETKLLKDAASVGCKIVNGLEMLLYQGVAQFELWTGEAAPVEVMRAELMKATGNTPS